MLPGSDCPGGTHHTADRITSPVANPTAAKWNCMYTQRYQLLQKVTPVTLSVLQVINASKQTHEHLAGSSTPQSQAARCFPAQPSPCLRTGAGHLILRLETTQTARSLPSRIVKHRATVTQGRQSAPLQPPGLTLPSASRAKPKPNSSSILISCVV